MTQSFVHRTHLDVFHGVYVVVFEREARGVRARVFEREAREYLFSYSSLTHSYHVLVSLAHNNYYSNVTIEHRYYPTTFKNWYSDNWANRV